MSLEDGFNINDLFRRLANIVRIGTILEVDYQKARAKVKIGDIKTGFLPWCTERAGLNKNWNPLDIGEQVVILSPNGELDRGVILPSLYQTSNPAPGHSKDKTKNIFEDGTSIEYDKNVKSLLINLAGTTNITITGAATINAQTVDLTATQTTVNGNATITGEVYLAGGGKAVARVGDKVSVDPNTHIGKIDAGSEKVFAGG